MSAQQVIGNGIPEGLSLEPHLFNILMNDVSSHLRYTMPLLYADDLKFLDTVTSKSDIDKIQNIYKMN